MNSLEEKLNGHHYGVKTIDLKVSDVDLKSRQVKGYFASFDTLDSDRDIIRKGAFTKSIQERGVNSSGNRKIAHLRNHDWDHQIGRLDELGEDSKGLYFVSTLGTSSKGEDALRDYQEGILIEHSIGFNYIPDRIEKAEDSVHGEYFNVTEVKLWEGSAVTFGANSLTPVIDVAKGLADYNEILEKTKELTADISQAVKSGRDSQNIELMFAQLKQLQHSLTNLTPSVKDTLDSAPTAEEIKEENRKQLLLTFLK